jgi:hypothetical protein
MLEENPSRKGFEILNTSAGDIWFMFQVPGVTSASAASPSYKVASGESWFSPQDVNVRGKWYAFGATTGQAVTCWEYI